MLTMTSIENYLANLIANGASEETTRAYRPDLTGALAYVGRTGAPPALDWPTTEAAFKSYLNDNRGTWAPKTTRRRLGTLRSWARYSGAPDTFLGDYRAPIPAPPQPHPIPESIDGVLRMIMSTRNPRHRALCTLTGLMGLRVHEAVDVRPDDFDMAEMTLTVRGKGSKTRIVPVSETAWKHLHKAYALADANGTTLVRIGNRGARAAISRHARNAGLSRHVASHDMRATFATAAYRKSKDLRAVQNLLGHADPATTQVYTEVAMTQMRNAAEVA